MIISVFSGGCKFFGGTEEIFATGAIALFAPTLGDGETDAACGVCRVFRHGNCRLGEAVCHRSLLVDQGAPGTNCLTAMGFECPRLV